MDNITHSLVALTLGNTGLRRVGTGALPVLLLASNVPDIEIVTAFTSGRVAYLAAHRGITHGVSGLLLGIATAVLVWLVVRWRTRPSSARASLAALTGLAILGAGAHILMDLATSYGTRVLSPFSPVWVGVDWLPIADVVLWAVLLGGILASTIRPRWRTIATLVSIGLAAGDYVGRAWLHERAIDCALAMERDEAGAAESPRPPLVFRYFNRQQPAALPAALPSLGSPFVWRLVTRTPTGFQVADVDLGPVLSGAARRPTVRRVLRFTHYDGPLTDPASEAPMARIFLDFSRFPAAEARRHDNGDTTLHWYDLRFARRPEPATDPRSAVSSFAVWVRLAPDRSFVAEGLGPGG